MARAVEETGQRGGKTGQNTAPMAAYLVCCPSTASLPLWRLAAPGELPALGFINPVVLQQAQHHSPQQWEPICRPGYASRKHNYHQACLAVLGSRSGGCWALITVAAASPDGRAARDAGSQPWGSPQHGWTQQCWGSWAQPIRPPRTTGRFLASKRGRCAEQREPFVPAPGGSARPSSPRSHRANPAQPRTGHGALPLGSTLP